MYRIFRDRKFLFKRVFTFKRNQEFNIVPVGLSTHALDKVFNMFKKFQFVGFFRGRLVLEVEFVSFLHQSSDSAVDPGLFGFIFGCFMWGKLTYGLF